MTKTDTDRPAPETTSRLRWAGLTALGLSGLLIALDSTILFTALPTLSARLGASTTQLQWISAAYTLAWAGLLLPAGVLGDRLGRRRVLLFGLFLFGASSVLASRATSADQLIALRAAMGAGAAVILPLTLSVLPTMFSEEERPRAVTLTAVATFLGLPLGPLIAGWLLTHYEWGSIFLINAPVVALALVGIWLFVPESRDSAAPRLDWIGAVLAVAAVVGIVYAIIVGPTDGWTSVSVLTGLVGGGAVLIAFVARELRTSAPLVDLHLFSNPRFTWSTIAFGAVGFAMTGVMFIVTPYFQIIQGTDAQGTGIRLLPMIGGLVLGGLIGDRLIAKAGPGVTIASGLFAASLGLAVLSQARTDTGYGLVAVGLGVLGVGIGLALPTALDTILGTLPPAMLGAGNALTRTVQQVAASLGVAILGSILNGVYRAGIDGHINGLPAPSQAAAQASLAGAAAIAHSLPAPVNAALLKTASDAYVRGMADATLLSAAILMVVAILALRSQLVRVSADERPTRAGAPPSLVVLIVILFGAAVFALVAGLSLVWPGTTLDALWNLNPTARTEFLMVGGRLAGLLLLCVGVFGSVAAVGLLKRQTWAWWLVLLLLVLVGMVNVIRFLAGDPGELFGTPFTLGLLWLHVHTRKSFKRLAVRQP